MSILKSIGAIVAGFVAVVLLSIATDFAVESVGIFPPASRPDDYTNVHWAIAASYRTLFNVVGGLVTARLAPGRPVTHAIILGCIGGVLAILGVVATWNMIPADSRWYPIALVITSAPFCWLGGKLAARRPAS